MRALPSSVPLGLIALLSAAHAEAHHPMATGSGAEAPRSRAALDLSAAEFDLQRRRGHFHMAQVTLEQAFFERFSIVGELAAARVAYADGHSAVGPGDASVGTRVLVYGDEIVTLTLGLALELPTGDEEAGLGDGHFMATPSAAFGLRPHPSWIFGVSFSDHLAIGETAEHASHSAGVAPGAAPQHAAPAPEPSMTHEEHAPIGSVLAPHSEREARLRVSVAHLWDRLYARAGAAFAFMLGDEHEVLGPLMLEGEIGVLAAESVRISLGLAGPVAGQKRLLWHGRLGIEYLF